MTLTAVIDNASEPTGHLFSSMIPNVVKWTAKISTMPQIETILGGGVRE
jgi:hypothetical protein